MEVFSGVLSLLQGDPETPAPPIIQRIADGNRAADLAVLILVLGLITVYQQWANRRQIEWMKKTLFNGHRPQPGALVDAVTETPTRLAVLEHEVNALQQAVSTAQREHTATANMVSIQGQQLSRMYEDVREARDTSKISAAQVVTNTNALRDIQATLKPLVDEISKGRARTLKERPTDSPVSKKPDTTLE